MEQSLFSGVVFLKFLALGAVFGLLFEICKIVKRISKNNIFIVNTIYFVYFCALGTCFCSFALKLCNGIVFWYAIVAIILGIIIWQISIGFLFTKFYNLVYNVFNKIVQRCKRTKLGNKLLR